MLCAQHIWHQYIAGVTTQCTASFFKLCTTTVTATAKIITTTTVATVTPPTATTETYTAITVTTNNKYKGKSVTAAIIKKLTGRVLNRNVIGGLIIRLNR